jgi:LmbE family N-acetylglucosaminyl deacetylase
VSDAGVYDAIYLSPHLDDAVLSCGGRIAGEVARGERVAIATCFTADEPAEPPSALAADLRRWWSLPPGEVMARRRAEDLDACARLGVETLHLDLPEAPYRLGAGGAPHYATLGALFGEPAAADAADLGPRLDERLRALPPHRRLLAPLGVGGHVDHRLVRAAAGRVARAAPALAHYEEFPYSEWKWFAVRRALGRAGDWVPEVVAVDAAAFERQVDSILAYVSQVPALFRTEARLRKQLRRHHRRAGGERAWRRGPSS